jgi:uncharacterized membrane protein
MVSIGGIIELFIIIAVNTATASLLTRFFRVRLKTNWGPVVFAILLIPVVLTILTQILGGLGFGFDLGSARLVVGITIVLPLVLGVTFDYFWMPAPEDVDLPEKYQQNS